MTISKVLLATNADLDKLQFPCLVSPKIDGIRCVTPGGIPKTRTMKDIPNDFIRRTFDNFTVGPYKGYANDLDGELVTFTGMVGSTRTLDDFNTIQSKVMSRDKQFPFELLVFDTFRDTMTPFYMRLHWAEERCQHMEGTGLIKLVPHVPCENRTELMEFEDYCIKQGYEGIMIRHPKGVYKQGRSTVKQGILLKLKRYEDIECTVIGWEKNFTKDGDLIDGSLGALVVTCPEFGRFNVGTGFTQQQRETFWRDRETLTNGLYQVTVKYQPAGMKDKPRFPVFKGWRHKDDI